MEKKIQGVKKVSVRRRGERVERRRKRGVMRQESAHDVKRK